MWGMAPSVRAAIGLSLEDKFRFLIQKLRAAGTRALAEKHAPPVPGSFPIPGAGVTAMQGPEDVSGLSD
jgi:hypothetical protein